ncbi:Hcp family type VI secretion system effector [Sphingomonas bacterium]|uniref:Hcp family type VI secretion system effector n=1 Tax=Sphingomonas bacterium TaxID=1895847 RepID=UPI001575743D|nr:type VI secretion system tube protein Hcp [Sphingomonas bacterium]
MAVDWFLEIAEIPGESTAEHMKGKIDVSSMSLGGSMPTTAGRTGSGLSVGKADFHDIHFSKYFDKATPKLLNAMGAGTHFGKAIFHGFKHGDKPMEFITITLTDVVVSSYQVSGSSGSEGQDSCSVTYSVINMDYVEQSEKGGSAGKSTFGFDVRAGKKLG